MSRLIFVAILISLTLFTGVMVTTAIAQTQPPPPYTGLKNPFAWQDTSVQEKGKRLYQQSCLGCHGSKGNNVAAANFSSANFPQLLEEQPDYYFWRVSEGNLPQGMPPYKVSLSEEQRWQLLTYLWTFGKGTTAPAPVESKPGETGTILRIIAPEQSQTGQPMEPTALLRDNLNHPIAKATVEFFIKVDFFNNDLMKIGEATTDDKGVASIKYTSWQTGNTEIIARYNTIETKTTVFLLEGNETTYQTEAGIKLPTLGKEVFVGPESSRHLNELGAAPGIAFRLPGGLTSWLLLLVFAIILIWSTYFRVMYNALRISLVKPNQDIRNEEIHTSLLPLAVLAFVLMVGTFLVFKVLVGPYSHFNLAP